MDLSTLKTQLLSNTAPSQLIIFVTEENSFIAQQYIDKIAEIKNLQINKVQSISDILNSSLSLVFKADTNLNIIQTDVFSEDLDYESCTNCIVVCNKVADIIADKVMNYTVSIPKLQDWQVEDYIVTICPGLDINDAKLLRTACNNNIYKIDNELSKISLFELEQQKYILSDLYYDSNSDLYHFDFFNFINSICAGDKVKVFEFFKHEKLINEEPLSVISNLLVMFKKALFIKYNSGVTAQQLGLFGPRLNEMYNCFKNVSPARIMQAIDFLSHLDRRLKAGKLDANKDTIIDYVICEVL